MPTRSRHSRHSHGVTLLEGMISTVILLTGIIGVLQGLVVATQQNSMANRQTRASVLAAEVLSMVQAQGRANNLAAGGLFATSNCKAFTSLPAAVQNFGGDLYPVPPSFTAASPGLAWPGVSACYVDLDGSAGLLALTPGYSSADDAIYTRVLAVYQSTGSNPEIMFIGVNIGWRDAGRIRNVKRLSAIYDISVNQTNLEF